MIIALLNQKGGVGKTTLAVHLAAEIARTRQSVMVVDADPQGSALDWSEARQRSGYRRLFGVIGIPRETLYQEIPAIAAVVDHVIIDGPPRVTALARSAMMAADYVLIPVQPSPYDVWACTDIVALVREAMIFKPKLRAAFVISRRIVRTIIGREASTALEQFGLPVLHSAISQRIAFAESAIYGSLVRDLDPRGPAQSEVQMLLAEPAGDPTMSGKRPPLSVKAPDRIADAWVKNRARLSAPEALSRSQTHTARLTLDITPALRRTIKLAAISKGVTVAEPLRALLDREFETCPKEHP